MNYLVIIGQILLFTFCVGLLLWGLKYSISLLVFSRKREHINKLQARISILKLHLKAKVKRKNNKIELVLKNNSEAMRLVHPNLVSMCGLEFNSQTDYQTLVTALSSINDEIVTHIKMKNKKNNVSSKDEDDLEDSNLTEYEKINLRYKKLVKYDKGHVLIIIEIVKATDELVEKMTEFNELVEFDKSQKKYENIPQPIEIESFELLSAVFEELKKSIADNQDFLITDKSAA